MTGTFPEALKQGRTAMPYQSHKRARKREKLSTHKLWPQRRTVNPQKQCAADEKAQRRVIVLAARKDEHPSMQMYLSRGRGSDRSVKHELRKSQVQILPSAPEIKK